MIALARILGLIVFALALLTFIRLPSGPLLYLTGLKMLAGAITPILALVGGVTLCLAGYAWDLPAFLLGLAGLILATSHVAMVTRPHRGFEAAFGPEWQQRISGSVRSRWRQHRYWPPRLHADEVPWQRDVVVGTNAETGVSLRADLWLPPEATLRTGSGVIYLHGSGWHFLSKDFLTRPFFRYLARQGYVVMDLAYTLAPVAGLKDMVGEVRRAIAWMKIHGPEMGVSEDRIILMGASAGAHLALLTAYTLGHPGFGITGGEGEVAVRGVVSYYGVSDLAAAHRYLQRIPSIGSGALRMMERMGVLAKAPSILGAAEAIPSLMRGLPSQKAADYDLGSPIYHAGPRCPPTLQIQGAHDFGVEVSQSRQLHAALRRAGVPALYVELPCTEHAFDLFVAE